MFDVQFGGRLSRSTDVALLDVHFQPIKIVGFVEHELDLQRYLDLDSLLLASGSWRLFSSSEKQ